MRLIGKIVGFGTMVVGLATGTPPVTIVGGAILATSVLGEITDAIHIAGAGRIASGLVQLSEEKRSQLLKELKENPIRVET